MPVSNGIPWVQTYLGRQLRMPEFNADAINVVEHATKPLRCMDRLLAKAAMVWPVGVETVVSK